MTASLKDLPAELIEHIISCTPPDRKSRLGLRAVCQRLNQMILARHGPEYFGTLSGKFNPRTLQRLYEQAASYAVITTFTENLHLDMTIRMKQVLQDRVGGWDRDSQGYLISPDRIPEIQTLREIIDMLPNCRRVRLQYEMYEAFTELESGAQAVLISLEEMASSILAVCAATGIGLQTVQLAGMCNGAADIVLDAQRRLQPQWGQPSKPLLQVAGALVSGLRVRLHPRNSKDLEWAKSFYGECVRLQDFGVQISMLQAGRPWGLPHRFFNDLSLPSAPLPPVERLVLNCDGFTETDFKQFVGRFGSTLRSLELHDVRLYKGGSWTSVLQWMAANLLFLESFECDRLREADTNRAGLLTFSSILSELTPALVSRTSNRPTWMPVVDFRGAGQLLMAVDRMDPRTNGIFMVKYAGCKAGADEALQMLVQAATFPAHRETKS